ncbi:hypothetical protein ABKN59_009284 [Abortiporus biennis]
MSDRYFPHRTLHTSHARSLEATRGTPIHVFFQATLRPDDSLEISDSLRLRFFAEKLNNHQQIGRFHDIPLVSGSQNTKPVASCAHRILGSDSRGNRSLSSVSSRGACVHCFVADISCLKLNEDRGR